MCPHWPSSSQKRQRSGLDYIYEGMHDPAQYRYASSWTTQVCKIRNNQDGGLFWPLSIATSHRGRGSGLPGFGLGNMGICMTKNDPVTVGLATTTSSGLQATEGSRATWLVLYKAGVYLPSPATHSLPPLSATPTDSFIIIIIIIMAVTIIIIIIMAVTSYTKFLKLMPKFSYFEPSRICLKSTSSSPLLS